VVNEFLDDLEIHVGFEQSHADFPQGFVHVLLGQGPLPAKILKCALEFF
jgi:hypothetical protein